MISAHRYFTRPVDAISDLEEADFFAGIRLANRTYKKTSSGRLRDLDAILIRLAQARGWQSPSVLDVGVSSGVTTREMVLAMQEAGLKADVLGTDIAIKATIVDLRPGLRALVDARGNPLQYELLGIGMRAWNRRLDTLTGYGLLTRVIRRLATNLPKTGRQAVTLISRRAGAGDAMPEIVEDDLALRNPSFEGRFDIVRAANILNRGYFEPDKLRAMVHNVKSYARGPGALIAILRTLEDGVNNGTIFELAPDRSLVALERVGKGSEIEDIL
jgi:hypothetical protein